jgi:hypothetical protein
LAGRIEVLVNEIIWTATMVHVRSAIDLYNLILSLASETRQKQQQKAPNLFTVTF